MAGGHRVMNRVVNPLLRRVLRGPLGRRLGRSLAVVRYTGRRTGEPHELVCQYVRDGGRVWVLVGGPDRKTWWRSLRSPAPVDLWLAGRHHSGMAVAVVGREQPEECARGLAAYAVAVPRAGALAVPDVVLVRADLPGN
jgi:hypothetical protein